jgi:hypothetical protein
MNNKNETRQGPAFRALVRGLDETSRLSILSILFYIIIIHLEDKNDHSSLKSK